MGFFRPEVIRGQLGRVAFVMSRALGDSLVSMVIVNNLIRNGVQVTVFGSHAFHLRDWFPQASIRLLPSDIPLDVVLADFDTVIQMHLDQPFDNLWRHHPRVLTLHDVEYSDRPGCMAERFARYCRDELGLPRVSLENGMRAPDQWQHRRFRRRVAIHPEASSQDKRWSPERFLRLARRLQQRGYEVQFIIAPHERDRWQSLLKDHIVAPYFKDVEALAGWIYESGYFIGNDSGVGHLASSLGIPTLSLFRRKRTAERWRPAWGEVRVVLSWQWIPSAFLRELVWRQTLSCRRVLRAFSQVVDAHSDPHSEAHS